MKNNFEPFSPKIEESPTDRRLRLVLADWLRDQGDDDFTYAFEWAAKVGYPPSPFTMGEDYLVGME
jgi:uncharacterized protein (TIGR02996 family)